jgi:hypothetical protein
MLVANAYQRWKADPKGIVGIVLTKNWHSLHREKIEPNNTYIGITNFLDYLCGRHLIEIVSKGRKYPNSKQGIPTHNIARRGVVMMTIKKGNKLQPLEKHGRGFSEPRPCWSWAGSHSG